MTSFEEIVRLSIKDSPEVQPPALLAERVILAIEIKKSFYTLVKLAVYSVITVASFVGFAIVWRSEWANITNSEAAQLLTLLFSDSSLIATYWKDYIISLSESLPIVSIISIAAFIWAACASLWMTARTYITFSHRSVERVKS